MADRDKKRGRAWDEAGRHPIAWFSALVRGVDEQNLALIDRAQAELEMLGYFVVPYPSSDRRGGEVGR